MSVHPPDQAPTEVPLPAEKPPEEKAQSAPPPAPVTAQKVKGGAPAVEPSWQTGLMRQLQRFKRYPQAAHGKSGTVVVRFVLNRSGKLTDSAVSKSSGNDVLDHEALDILQRANPFPPFPEAKPGAQDTYFAPVNFAR